MEEKIIIKGVRAEKRLGKKFLIISAIIFVVGFVGALLVPYYFAEGTVFHKDSRYHDDTGFFERIIHGNLDSGFLGMLVFVIMWIGLLLLVIWIIYSIIYRVLASTELTISDKRTYGKIGTKKRVDIPTDSISAIGTCHFNGVTITSASGLIKFHFLKNRNEIHKVLSDLIIERQNKSKEPTSIIKPQTSSDADELKKYKELLDNGVITQEEFDAKKKQILGV